jgi:hypothetical protein
LYSIYLLYMNVHVACRFLPYEFNIKLFVQAVFSSTDYVFQI